MSTISTADTQHTKESLLSYPDLLSFCRVWEEEGRCPIGFGDWLDDNGLPGAGFARWACEEKDRPTYTGDGTPTGTFGPFGGVYPHSIGVYYYEWSRQFGSQNYLLRRDLPFRVFEKLYYGTLSDLGGAFKSYASFAEAIVAVLLVWDSAMTGSSEKET